MLPWLCICNVLTKLTFHRLRSCHCIQRGSSTHFMGPGTQLSTVGLCCRAPVSDWTAGVPVKYGAQWRAAPRRRRFATRGRCTVAFESPERRAVCFVASKCPI